MALFIRNLGRVSYSRCLKVQEGICCGGEQQSTTLKLPIKNSLVLAEHSSPVFTYGYFDSTDLETGNQIKDLSRLGFGTFKLNKREQGIIWHGPGQLTVYPILSLPNDSITKRDYNFTLEKVIKSVLKQIGIDCKIQNDSILINNNLKIGDINIFSDFMTKPGFSINVNPNLKYFEYINLQGLKNTTKNVTSIWGISQDSSITVGEIFPLVIESFGKEFGFKNMDSDQLYMSILDQPSSSSSSQTLNDNLYIGNSSIFISPSSTSSSSSTTTNTISASSPSPSSTGPLSFYCMTNTHRRVD